jgi:hypothetical protein
MLRAQPDIFLPDKEELHYFDNKDGLWDQGLAAYQAFFADAKPDQICGEITPDYLGYAPCCQRIHDLLPNPRLIVILRDPVERAWSHYWLSAHWGGETRPFAEAIQTESARTSQGDIYSDVAFAYLGRGRYVEHLQRYAATFGRESLLVLFLSDLKRNPNEVLVTIRRHLGLPDTPPPHLSTPTQSSLETGQRSNAIQYFPRHLGVNRKLRQYLSLARQGNSIPHKIARKVIGYLMKVNQRTQIPQLNQEMAARLQSYFEPYDASLAEWLGQELPWRRNGGDRAGKPSE